MSARADARKVADILLGTEIRWLQDSDSWIAYDPVAKRAGARLWDFRIAIVEKLGWRHTSSRPWLYKRYIEAPGSRRYFKTREAAMRAAEKDWRSRVQTP